MSPTYIFTRHGESTVNRTRTLANRLPDSAPLTERGRSQARALLRWLQQYPVRAVYASPLTRAKETAAMLAAAWGLAAELVDGLREPDCGLLEGRNDPQAWRLHAAQERAWKAGHHEYRIPGGESFTDLQQRFMPGVSRIVSKYENDAGAVLLVSHGSVLRYMLPLMVANLDAAFTHTHALGHCACVVVTGTRNGLVCVEWDGQRLAS